MAADYGALIRAPRGRDCTHPGYSHIASWVAGRLRDRGLRPAGNASASGSGSASVSGTSRYFQRFAWDQRFTSGQASSVNVIGVLPGDGSTNEAVMVLAHLDGLSAAQKRGIEREARQRGAPLDMSGYQGANDNASAVVSALYISDVLSRLQRRRGRPLRRDVVFVFPAAEEEGLKGTEALVRFGRQLGDRRFVGAINFEMVGRGDPRRIRMYGGETGVEAGANSLYGRAMRQRTKGNTARLIPGHEHDQGQGWFRRSDHYVTARSGIPSVMYLGQAGEYHRPGDSLGRINLNTTRAVARHAVRLVAELADAPGPAGPGSALPAEINNNYPGRVFEVGP